MVQVMEMSPCSKGCHVLHQVTIAAITIIVVYMIFSTQSTLSYYKKYHPRQVRMPLQSDQVKHTFAREDLEFSEKAQAEARKKHKPVVLAGGEMVQPLQLKIDDQVHVKHSPAKPEKDSL
ncbi:hypothetical protein HOLleu_34598 [Holothuria leucospilota]|uniref:Uncharacterized protein n=1 Tax=Holothuria leucospilota TaxID=206669 RepID=A0A9Q0YNH1_HOLLE|nr:hypothetical protein HOLleu_34598 [Holothuria leucospilota]